MTFTAQASRTVIVAIGLICVSATFLFGQEIPDMTDFDYVPEKIAKQYGIPTVSGRNGESGSSPVEPAQDLLTVIGIETLPATREALQIEGIVGAVAVVKIRENSVGTRLNVNPGDMIIRLNDQPVADPDQLSQLIEREYKAGKTWVAMQLLRPTENVSLVINVPLPLYGQRYTNAEAAYTLTIPDGWFLIPHFRNRIVDDAFDTLFSPDLSVVAIIARAGIPLTNPFAELEEYKRQKLAEAQKLYGIDVGYEAKIFSGELGFRVFYRAVEPPFSISRMAFVFNSKRYVINVVAYGVEHTALPMLADEMLRSISFPTE